MLQCKEICPFKHCRLPQDRRNSRCDVCRSRSIPLFLPTRRSAGRRPASFGRENVATKERARVPRTSRTATSRNSQNSRYCREACMLPAHISSLSNPTVFRHCRRRRFVPGSSPWSPSSSRLACLVVVEA